MVQYEQYGYFYVPSAATSNNNVTLLILQFDVLLCSSTYSESGISLIYHNKAFKTKIHSSKI